MKAVLEVAGGGGGGEARTAMGMPVAWKMAALNMAGV